uniref:ribosomal protein L20 n=1 Tax=Symbiochloris sp. SG-2018 TaxID=2126034 RepID=UPI002113C901|nr:ribosomal protein L20 [Symbiochloris sp. SG-2018]UTQ75765.1 ribosomal protein L20 [Symbiochloris sp. SG-2018]
MTRVKRGYVARNRRKKILKITKGFRSSVLFRPSNQRAMKALKYSYRDRRQKKREVRALWISRINNTTRNYKLNYNQFIHKLKKLNISINRKWLSQLALQDPHVFYQLINY